MRDFSSCISEYSVDVSDTSCSSYSNKSCINVSPSSTPSIQNSVTCYYKTVLSTQKRVSITVTWSKTTTMSQSLTINFAEEDQEEEEEEENPPKPTFKLNTNPRLFKKLKGSKILLSSTTRIEIFWDLSSARYQTRPEPVSGYYILVTVDSEPGLILGDSKKLKPVTKPAKSSLFSRREYFSGNTHYSTKARFCDSGGAHDISIRCVGEDEEGVKNPVLCVCVDKKMVMRVKRLKWNFRGNQTIFLDGLLVDLMWDVHDWFYNPVSANGNAVFMFRTRSGSDTRLWRLDQKPTAQKDGGDVHEFSLMIYACKNI